MSVSTCGGCKKETEFSFRCSKCENRFCSACLRVDMSTKSDVCQTCMGRPAQPKVLVQNIESGPSGFVVRWRFVEKEGWGELSFFLKAEKWHMDTESLSDETVDAVLQAIRKFAVRAG